MSDLLNTMSGSSRVSPRDGVYQTAQIRELEKRAIQSGIDGFTLMQRAGQAACDFLLYRFPNAKKIGVLCGGGNNGGDGYVLAHLAHKKGLAVTVWQVGDHKRLKAEAAQALDMCQQARVPIEAYQETTNLNVYDVLVDAICGIGIKETLHPHIIALITQMHAANTPIFSLDIPTGVDADTGQIHGKAIQATATITFMGLKLGLLTGPGISQVGELILDDLQLPADLLSTVEPIAEKCNWEAYRDYLKPRKKDWHKGLSGHVLIIGGDLGYAGAPRMAAEAALRVGAGLVSVATRPEHAFFLNVNRPEIMCHGVSNTEQLQVLIARSDVLLLGPGLGQSDWSKTLWSYALKQPQPMVVDADALNLLSAAQQKNTNWILTPHPKEASRLLGRPVATVQNNRLAAIFDLAKRYDGVSVLKGAGSLVLAPGSLPMVCDKGNPGMASAGMGDVLSGVIAGLLSQGIPLGDAAKLGVYLHAMAGDEAAKAGERGTLAMDLMPALRKLCN